MNRFSIGDFVKKTQQRDLKQGTFELENDRMLEVNLDGEIWIKLGTMIAYRGEVKFTREGLLSQGLGNLFKKAISGEGARLTKASGTGKIYLADLGKKITILSLENDSIFVNGNDVLAFEPQVQNEIKMMKRVSAMLAGGLFNVRLSGTGLIAFTTHYDPVTLKVTPGNPVRTDPNATVAWSGDLQPELRKDVSFKTFMGRGSGESLQMEFTGEGWVVVQPYEESYFQAGGGAPG